jgi:hypothetical protein
MKPVELCGIATIQGMEDTMMQGGQKLKSCNVDFGGQPYLTIVRGL